jgi:hypothetical protein
MKIIMLSFFLLLVALRSFAQYDDEKLLYMRKAEKYRKMQNAGAVLTVGGAILTVVGFVTLQNSSITTTSAVGGNGPSQTTVEGHPFEGMAAFLLGNGGLGAGIPLWIIGANNHRKYTQKLEGVSLKFNLTPQRSGVLLTYRF